GVHVGLLDQSAKDIYFAVLEPNVMFDAALADNPLVDHANICGSSLRGDHHVDFQADFAVWVNARGDVYVHADVQVLKLRVHQRIDYSGARAGRTDSNSGLKTTGRHGNTVADFEFGGLSIDHANFRVIENLR